MAESGGAAAKRRRDAGAKRETNGPGSRGTGHPVENAAQGVVVDSLIAPSLVDVTFTNIEDDRHVVVGARDIVLPEVRMQNEDDTGYDYNGTEFDTVIDEVEWALKGPQHVVFPNTSSAEIGGTKDLPDVLVQGLLTTTKGDSDEMVLFSGAAGDSLPWGSVFFDTPSSGSVIDHGEIMQASTGIFLFYPDDVTVECSLIHSFADAGIHIYGASGDGALIENNTVELGNGPLGGIDGIRLERADECTVSGNHVDGSGILGGTVVRSGIRILNAQHFCLNFLPNEARSQTIAGNRVEGPGILSTASNLSAIDADWACGSTNRTVSLSGNYIDKWPETAVRFDQSIDLDFGCNGLENNRVGVDYARTGLATKPAVRFKRNGLIAVEDAAAAVRSTEASTLDLGPNDTYTGQNVLRLVDLVAPFIIENDPDSLYLDARYNYWYRSDSLQTAMGDIEARIGTDLDSAQVDVSSFYTSGPTICYPDSSLSGGCPQSGSRLLGALANASSGNGREPRTPPRFETALGLPSPNPFDRTTRLHFIVGTNAPGRYRIDVFNVAGRRVRTLLDGFPAEGPHDVLWKGDSESGSTVAPGVYFVRMIGPVYDQKRKLVRLR